MQNQRFCRMCNWFEVQRPWIEFDALVEYNSHSVAQMWLLSDTSSNVPKITQFYADHLIFMLYNREKRTTKSRNCRTEKLIWRCLGKNW